MLKFFKKFLEVDSNEVNDKELARNDKNSHNKNLILHIGPGKCGSSSIQTFLETKKNKFSEKIEYNFLDPAKISDLNYDKPNKKILKDFSQSIANNLDNCDIQILSHEFLFQNPKSVKNLCKIANDLNLDVTIIGYCRRQSEFLRSAYSQWLFRSRNRIIEVHKILNESGLDPNLFSGLESQFIASILNDFYSARQLTEYSILDWYKSYNTIFELVNEFGGVIKCGLLPGKKTKISLIEDFCNKSGLTLTKELENTKTSITNTSFNYDVVEAINNAALFGIDTAGPHDNNDIIELLSSKMNTDNIISSNFFTKLKTYVDSYYWESNKKLCDQYNLNENYFSVPKTLNKQEILEVIFKELGERSLNKSEIIERYRLLSARMAELCFNLKKDD